MFLSLLCFALYTRFQQDHACPVDRAIFLYTLPPISFRCSTELGSAVYSFSDHEGLSAKAVLELGKMPSQLTKGVRHVPQDRL